MLPILQIRDGVDDGAPNPQGQALVAVSFVFGAIAALLVVARWITRVKIYKLIGADDWFILAALLVDFGLIGLAYREVQVGFGLHNADVDMAHEEQGMHLFLAYQIMFKGATMLTKVSILLLFLRIFTSRWFRIACWVTIGVVVAFGMSIIIASIAQCTPIAKAYDPSLPGHCILVGDVWYAHGGFAILSDIWMIILPLRQLPSLKLPRVQKIGLAMIFSIGVFVIIIEIIRLALLGPVTTSKDYTYYQASGCLWAGLEVNVGIICACAPMLRAPLLRFRDRYFPRFRSNSSASRSKSARTWPNAYANENKSRASRVPSRDLIYSASRKERDKERDSDEEIMLEGRGIVKTTNVQVDFHDPVPGEMDNHAFDEEGLPPLPRTPRTTLSQ